MYCARWRPALRAAFFFFVLVGASLVMASSAAFAQVRSDLRGRVLDPSRAAIPGANIELTERATGIHRSTVSTRSGDYVFGGLTPGAYSVEVAASGFQRLKASGVTVAVGQTR